MKRKSKCQPEHVKKEETMPEVWFAQLGFIVKGPKEAAQFGHYTWPGIPREEFEKIQTAIFNLDTAVQLAEKTEVKDGESWAVQLTFIGKGPKEPAQFGVYTWPGESRAECDRLISTLIQFEQYLKAS